MARVLRLHGVGKGGTNLIGINHTKEHNYIIWSTSGEVSQYITLHLSFGTSYTLSGQIAELRILISISGHIDMNVPRHSTVEPIPLLILKG